MADAGQNYWDAINDPDPPSSLVQMRTDSNNGAIAEAARKRRLMQGYKNNTAAPAQRQAQGPQSIPDSLNKMMVGGYASAGPRVDAAVGSIGGTLNANADRINQASIADATEQGKTRRLGMLMSMMAPMLSGGGMGGGGGFMTNFGQAAIPGSMFGMGGGGGGGAFGAGMPMADGKIDYNAMDTHNSFMRQNMLKNLAGIRGVMGMDPGKFEQTGSNPTFGQMFGGY